MAICLFEFFHLERKVPFVKVDVTLEGIEIFSGNRSENVW